MKLSRDDLTKVMSNKTDEQLLGVLSAYSKDYSSDAIEIAREEFERRKLDPAALKNLYTNIERTERLHDAGLKFPSKMTAFFFSTVFLGIPVILAHRHFVENGARRKAREWGRWALYGFAFYVALFVVRNAVGPMHALVTLFMAWLAGAFYLFWFGLVPWIWRRLASSKTLN